jgi:GTPase
MPFTVAIIGRPNVGKSTLFNRLAGRRQALVDDRPGLTRDRREAPAQLGDLAFNVIDTAGLEEAAAQSLEAAMRTQTERAVAAADLVLFVVDGRAGVTPLDRHFASWLRTTGAKVVLVVNKSESQAAAAAGIGEAYGLGFGDPVPISAEHNEGFADLHEALAPHVPHADVEPEPEEGEVLAGERAIRLAIVGRPNVGKSTLVNRLLGEERMVTSAEPGTTRDAIAVPFTWRDRPLVLIDTAGLRRKSRIVESPEALSASDSLRTIRECQVAVLVLDATLMLEKQDLAIASLVVEEGRALVVAVNKWDLIDDRQAALRRLRDRLEISLPQAKGVTFATVSALAGTNLKDLMAAVFETYRVWNTEIATGPLNRWLERATEAHPPPLVQGRRPSLRFMRQTATRPPTFTVFGRKLSTLPDDYTRYLTNGLREVFDLPGVPIRLRLRQTENPYVEGGGG